MFGNRNPKLAKGSRQGVWNKTNHMEPATLYVMPGSQYSAKAIVALTSRDIPHYCVFSHAVPSKRVLPSGGRMVPEAVIGEAIIPDSDEILRHYDEHHGTDFFPDVDVSTLTKRLSEGVLAGSVLYYNWVHPPGYERTMRATFEAKLPSYVCLFRGLIIDHMCSDARANFRRKAQVQLNVPDATLNDEAAIRKLLMDELVSVQALISEQTDLLANASRPSAADCTLYAMLERLVGDMGDVRLPCALPELATEPQLEQLMAWHRRMREKLPIKFKGKRPPHAAGDGTNSSSSKVGVA